MLAKAAVEGKLATRADASKHGGDYRKIVEGVNSTLDAVIGPLNVAADYVDKISRGAIPSKISDTYNGDFNTIKNNLNSCIDNINALVADANMLAKAAVDGKLATRADAAKHGGDYRKIVEGVNSTLDAVIGPLNVAADYVDKISRGAIPSKISDTYNGDFNTIKNNLNSCIDNINALVADANMLAKAAVDGKLATRADAAKHGGDYRKIVEGVNSTLDAVIGPLNVAANYVDRISKGDLPPQITDTYHGDFNTIKNNLNTLIVAMNDVTPRRRRDRPGQSDGYGSRTFRPGQADAGLDRNGRGPYAYRDRHPRHCRRSVVRQPVYQRGFGPGIERRQRAGRVRRRSLLLHGGNGLQHQAERRQRAADRQDRHQVGQGRAGERQVRAGSGRGDEGNRQQDLHHRGDCPPDQPVGS